MNSFIFTCGDINGIGPEISVKTFNKVYNDRNVKIIFICPSNIFLDTTKNIKPKFEFEIKKPTDKINLDSNIITILDLGAAKQSFGKVTANAGKISFDAINLGVKLIKENRAEALITSPISKKAFEKSKIRFPGHTELLAELTNSKDYAMMFLSEKIIASMLTIHIPIKKVSASINTRSTINKIKIIGGALKKDLNIKNPKIALLGLNPHAGEEGNIGDEEKKILIPAIKKIKEFDVFGPFVPDAFFGNKSYKNYDVTIGSYHDQVLIPFKLISFNTGVNYTAGLPIIRSSPDHGTAFDIAGKFIADPSSMISAFRWAKKILYYRKKNES